MPKYNLIATISCKNGTRTTQNLAFYSLWAARIIAKDWRKLKVVVKVLVVDMTTGEIMYEG